MDRGRPIVYDNLDGYAQLTRRAKDPIQIWREFLWPPRLTHRVAEKGV